jgi:hypothetical protein
MTKSIIAMVGIIIISLLTACAREDESRDSSGAKPPAPPVAKPTPINTGSEFDPQDFPNIKNSIFGAWDADTAEFGSGLAYLMSLYLNDKGQVGVRRVCLGKGEELDVATVVTGEVSSSKIKITQSATVSESGSRITDCTLKVDAGSFSYKRTQDRLEVTFPPGETRSFTRARK